MKYKIWDKKESINGVDASYVIETHHIKEEDEVFLIIEGGRVVAIEMANVIKSVYRLDPDLTVDEVAKEYIRIKEEQENQVVNGATTLEEHNAKINKLEKDSADLMFAIMNGGLM